MKNGKCVAMDADPDFESTQAKEMLDQLEIVLANEPVVVKRGQFIVEVKPQISPPLFLLISGHHLPTPPLWPSYPLAIVFSLLCYRYFLLFSSSSRDIISLLLLLSGRRLLDDLRLFSFSAIDISSLSSFSSGTSSPTPPPLWLSSPFSSSLDLPSYSSSSRLSSHLGCRLLWPSPPPSSPLAPVLMAVVSSLLCSRYLLLSLPPYLETSSPYSSSPASSSSPFSAIDISSSLPPYLETSSPTPPLGVIFPPLFLLISRHHLPTPPLWPSYPRAVVSFSCRLLWPSSSPFSAIDISSSLPPYLETSSPYSSSAVVSSGRRFLPSLLEISPPLFLLISRHHLPTPPLWPSYPRVIVSFGRRLLWPSSPLAVVSSGRRRRLLPSLL
ncbi:hypothetical protein IFM89_027465 [Coptis chinensis]|uniref:Uncharacterized protein n=1 Tax=Coptis chinensis TaxID=261450 RepID=A0A835HPU9_9MAGN|nr:hypothetical protein IFM89_027465 [Coptis chinensis]